MKFYVILGFILFTICAPAQEIAFQKVFTIEDGLDNNIVDQVFRDGDGKFWMISEQSIQIFDGQNFESVTSPSLNAQQVLLFQEQYLCYIIDTNRLGILDCRDKTYQEKTFEADQILIHQNEIFLVKKTSDASRVFTLNASFTEEFLSSWNDTLSILQVYNAGNTTLLLSSALELFDIKTNTRIDKDVNEIIGEVQNDVWIRKNKNQIFKYSNGIPTIIDSLEYKHIHYKKTSSNQIILGLSNHSKRIQKFIAFDHGKQVMLDAISGRSNTYTDYYTEDFNDQILLTSHEGVKHMRLNPYVKKYNNNTEISDGEYGSVVWYSFIRGNNTLHYAKESIGLFEVTETGSKQILPNNKYKNAFHGNYFGYYNAHNDILLGASKMDGVSTLDIYNFKTKELKVLEQGHFTADFLELSDKHILCASSKANQSMLYILDIVRGEILSEIIVDSTSTKVRNIEGSPDELYLTTNKNVFRGKLNIDDNFNMELDLKDTLTAGDILVGKRFKDKFLVGTYGKGLMLIDGERNSYLSEREGLTGDIVHSIEIDSTSNIIVATLKGLSILDKDVNLIKNLSKKTGLSSSNLNMNTLWISEENQLHTGSVNGLNVIDIDGISKQVKSSRLVLEGIKMFENGIPQIIATNQHKAVQIPYGVDSVSLSFRNYDFQKSKANRNFLFLNNFKMGDQRYALVGNELPIQNLKSGKNKITWTTSDKEALEITLDKVSFFSHYKFRLLSALLFFLLFLHILRNQKARAKQEAMLAQKEQEAKLSEMHIYALRSQMNPHFIFNALGSIQYYIQKEDSETAEEYLTDFAQLMRLILESSKEDVVSLEEEIHMIELYCKMEELRYEKKFKYTIDIDEELNKNLKIPSMVTQPFIENSINHGLFHLKDQSGHLEISFRKISKTQVDVIINDNGVGRVKSKAFNKKNHKSRAMQIINERKYALQTKDYKPLDFHVEDAYPNNENVGTKVTINFRV